MNRSASQHPPLRPPPTGLPPTGLPPPRNAGWLRALVIAAGVVWLTWLSSPTAYPAQEEDPVYRENRIKASYLYQLGRHVDWPPQAFADPQAPFVIGVLTQHPVALHLDEAAKAANVRGRPIQILRITPDGDVPACHVLYVPGTLATERQAALIRRSSGKGVLLVGESEQFLRLGGVIRFVLEENNIRLYLSLEAAKREKLTIRSSLRQVARAVD